MARELRGPGASIDGRSSLRGPRDGDADRPRRPTVRPVRHDQPGLGPAGRRGSTNSASDVTPAARRAGRSASSAAIELAVGPRQPRSADADDVRAGGPAARRSVDDRARRSPRAPRGRRSRAGGRWRRAARPARRPGPAGRRAGPRARGGRSSPAFAPAAAVSRQWFDQRRPTRDEGVGAIGERRADEELEVAQLVAAERERQQVLALDPDVGAAAERLREARQPMERRRAVEQAVTRRRRSGGRRVDGTRGW